MLNRRLFLSIVCVGSLVIAAGPALAAEPLKPLQYIYANLDIGREAEPFSARLQSLYDAAAKRSEELQEPVPGLDFDYAINAQDFEDSLVGSLKYEIVAENQTNAEVKVTFKNFDLQELRYFLVIESGAWVVDDVISKTTGNEWTFSELLKEGAK